MIVFLEISTSTFQILNNYMEQFIIIKSLGDYNSKPKTRIININKIIQVVLGDDDAIVIFEDFTISVDKAEILKKLNMEVK
mgnify:FL=1